MTGLEGELSRQALKLILREAVALGSLSLDGCGRHRKRCRYGEKDVGLLACCVVGLL